MKPRKEKDEKVKVKSARVKRMEEFAMKHYIKIVVGHCIFACTVIAVCLALYLKGIITSDLQYLISGIPVATHLLLKYFFDRLFSR